MAWGNSESEHTETDNAETYKIERQKSRAMWMWSKYGRRVLGW